MYLLIPHVSLQAKYNTPIDAFILSPASRAAESDESPDVASNLLRRCAELSRAEQQAASQHVPIFY